jgi:hypothetical protein
MGERRTAIELKYLVAALHATPLLLASRYTCRWRDYSQVTSTNGQQARFRYLLIAAQPATSTAATGSTSPGR